MLRAGLIAMSIMNLLLAGLATVSLEGEVGLYWSEPIVAILALTLQSGFSLGYLAGSGSRWAPLARLALFAGEAAALLVGGGVAISALLYNLNPVAGDLELAPLFFGGACAAHATVGLAYLAVHDRPTVT